MESPKLRNDIQSPTRYAYPDTTNHTNVLYRKKTKNIYLITDRKRLVESLRGSVKGLILEFWVNRELNIESSLIGI
jgi:hypothetical protein